MNSPTLRDALRVVDSFWMKPMDLRILEVIRRCYGGLLFLNVLWLWVDRRKFFGAGSWLPADAARSVVDPDTWNLFSVVSDSAASVDLALLSLFACAAMLSLGWIPRLSAILSLLLLTAIHHANMMLFDAEDNLFRLFAFFLVFVPPWTQLKKSASGTDPGQSSELLTAWPSRLFQIQVCLVYFCTAIQKSNGPEWLDGTALYYALRLDDATRFPLPAMITESLTATKYLTWSVLLLEFAVPVLIWFQVIRWWCLAAVVLFHLATDYSMNLHLFHPIMLTGFLAFVRFDQIQRCVRWPRSALPDFLISSPAVGVAPPAAVSPVPPRESATQPVPASGSKKNRRRR